MSLSIEYNNDSYSSLQNSRHIQIEQDLNTTNIVLFTSRWYLRHIIVNIMTDSKSSLNIYQKIFKYLADHYTILFYQTLAQA